jgi:hypothetical protein
MQLSLAIFPTDVPIILIWFQCGLLPVLNDFRLKLSVNTPFFVGLIDLLRNTPSTRIMHSTFPYRTLNSSELQVIIPKPTRYCHNFIIKPIFSVRI